MKKIKRVKPPLLRHNWERDCIMDMVDRWLERWRCPCTDFDASDRRKAAKRTRHMFWLLPETRVLGVRNPFSDKIVSKPKEPKTLHDVAWSCLIWDWEALDIYTEYRRRMK